MAHQPHASHRNSLDRRQFVAAASAMSLAGSWSQALLAAPTAKKVPVGVQLWTLRKETTEDLSGTLRKVAEIGYRGVELWFQKWPEAKELKRIVDDCGLKIASAHVNLKDLVDDFPRIAEYHRTIGNQTLVIPFVPNYAKLDDAGWRKTVDDIRHAARAGTEAGFNVLYHNHAFEFTSRVGDVEVFDMIFGTIDAKLLGAEIDVFFVADVGRDPVAMLRRFSGRLKRVHLKEKSKPGEKAQNTELGRGVINWPAVVAAATEAGAEWLLVEQNCEDRSALESIRISYDYLREQGLV
jgi:sugar phosphate isomerase/epimerase